jgi:hypothetical protein
MEDVDRPSEPNSVDRTTRVPVVIVDDFEIASTTESLQRLGERRFQSCLRIPQRSADSPLHLIGTRDELGLAGSHPAHGLRFSLRVLQSMFRSTGA